MNDRILIVTERFWPEDFVINDWAAEAARKGHKVSVLTQQPSYPRGRIFRGRRNHFLSTEDWNGVQIIRFKTVLGYRESLPMKLLNYLWFCLFGTIVALAAAPRFDRVFIYQTGPLTLAVPGIVVSKVRRKPCTIWTQDVWPDSVFAYGFKRSGLLVILLDSFVRWVYRSVDAILISCSGFKEILGRYTAKEMVYAPNWPLYPYVAGPGAGKRNDIPVFLFAGNVGKVQNLENVIKAFAIACRKRPDVGVLRVVGDGSALESLRKQAEAEGVPVEFPGRKAPSLMNDEYDKADFLVLSLANQAVFRLTVPSKFQMYLSVGKPILCACGGEVADVVKANDLGLVTDPDDPEDIAHAFLRFRDATDDEIRYWEENVRNSLGHDFDRETVQGRIVETVMSAARVRTSR